MIIDPIADLLTRIRNAQVVRHRSVVVPASKVLEGILRVLQDEGFIGGYERRPHECGVYDELVIRLKYYPNGSPLITTCRRVSKCGRRQYSRADKLSRVKGGLGIFVVSTSQGVMSDREARKRNIGGEVLASVS
jgi:small subunit ribosomal protein S8